MCIPDRKLHYGQGSLVRALSERDLPESFLCGKVDSMIGLATTPWSAIDKVRKGGEVHSRKLLSR